VQCRRKFPPKKRTVGQLYTGGHRLHRRFRTGAGRELAFIALPFSFSVPRRQSPRGCRRFCSA
jgi:hypothetical protein